MLFVRQRSVIWLGCLCTVWIGACKDGESSAEPNKGGSTRESVAIEDTPPVRESSATNTRADESKRLTLTGVSMVPPAGWGPATVQKGQFSTKTILRLPKADGDAQDATVEITHFPGMKGMDEQNINRWLAAVSQSDGSPHTRESAGFKVSEAGKIRLTVVDMSGSVRTSMMGSGGGAPDRRMIAAIVDHPKGPHFVKAVGGIATMNKWADSIDAFLQSARALPN